LGLEIIILLFIIWWLFILVLIIQLVTGESTTPIPQILALISAILVLYINMVKKDEVREFNRLFKTRITVKALFIITLLISIIIAVIYIMRLFI